MGQIKHRKEKAELHLFDLLEVRLVAAIGTSSALILAGYLIYIEWHNFSFFSADDINAVALGALKIPLGVLAATLAILGLLASNHRSVQSAYNARIASKHNNFSNFYSHFNEFKNYLSQWPRGGLFSFSNPAELHRIFYPNGKSGDLTLSKDFLKDFKKSIEKCINVIRKAKESTTKDTSSLSQLHHEFRLNLSTLSGLTAMLHVDFNWNDTRTLLNLGTTDLNNWFGMYNLDFCDELAMANPVKIVVNFDPHQNVTVMDEIESIIAEFRIELLESSLTLDL